MEGMIVAAGDRSKGGLVKLAKWPAGQDRDQRSRQHPVSAKMCASLWHVYPARSIAARNSCETYLIAESVQFSTFWRFSGALACMLQSF